MLVFGCLVWGGCGERLHLHIPCCGFGLDFHLLLLIGFLFLVGEGIPCCWLVSLHYVLVFFLLPLFSELLFLLGIPHIPCMRLGVLSHNLRSVLSCCRSGCLVFCGLSFHRIHKLVLYFCSLRRCVPVYGIASTVLFQQCSSLLHILLFQGRLRWGFH